MMCAHRAPIDRTSALTFVFSDVFESGTLTTLPIRLAQAFKSTLWVLSTRIPLMRWLSLAMADCGALARTSASVLGVPYVRDAC